MQYKIFFTHEGPAIWRDPDGTLRIEDLNPEVNFRWRVGRWELFKIGLRCLIASVRV